MKKTTFVLLFIVSAFTTLGQTLFFDNINNSTWASKPQYNYSTINASKEIGLGKLTTSTNALKENATVWFFKDGILTITYYEHSLKKETRVATYMYTVDTGKGLLTMTTGGNTVLTFKAGIVSTGNYVVLTKAKIRIKTPRSPGSNKS